MSLFSLFSEPLIWLFNTLFGTFRPFLNPFIGDRPLSSPPGIIDRAAISSDSGLDTALIAQPETRMLPQSRIIRRGGGAFRSWRQPPSETETIPRPPPKSDIWQPAIIDVLKTRKILQKASKAGLPRELLNTILDYAEYWPHVSASKEKPIVARGQSSYEDVLVIRTPPICAFATAGCEDDSLGLPEPTLKHPVRKVIFRIRSRDQGFSAEAPDTKGTYKASWTWFDTEIDKEFGPMCHEEPLSRIPWELSSTRFLSVWPKHSHSQEANEEERVRLSAFTGKGDSLSEEAGESGESDQGPSTNHVLTDDELPDKTNNPEHPEVPEPRLFSHQYLAKHRYEVQYNVQAKKEITEHTVVWRYTDDTPEDSPEAEELERIGRGRATGDGRFVRCLQLGDCVSLWAKARYLNWINHVETATVEVYFAI